MRWGLLVVLAAAWGCSRDASFRCAGDADCAGGYRCDDQACARTCGLRTECPAGYACNLDRGVCRRFGGADDAGSVTGASSSASVPAPPSSSDTGSSASARPASTSSPAPPPDGGAVHPACVSLDGGIAVDASCDDGRWCTSDDRCTAQGTCTGGHRCRSRFHPACLEASLSCECITNGTCGDAGHCIGGTCVVSLDLPVASGDDDAREDTSGNIVFQTDTVDLWGAGYRALVRWADLPIPRASRVHSAVLEVFVDVPFGPAFAEVWTLQSDPAGAPASSVEFNISSRSVLAQTVAWAAPITVAGPQASPEMKALVQQLVDGAGWGPANALVFIGRRTVDTTLAFRAYELGAGTSPHLRVMFTPP